MEITSTIFSVYSWMLEHKLGLFSIPATIVVNTIIPMRIGIGRAIVLAGKSKFFNKPNVLSSRKIDYERIKCMVNTRTDSGAFLIVTGPRGVGKTRVIETALARRIGVAIVPISPSATNDQILQAVYREVTGIPYKNIETKPSTLRVAKWHSFLFRTPITICLQTNDVLPGNEYAEIIPAASQLTSMGFQVVIDASENSYDPTAKKTIREHIISIEPMSRETLENIPELQNIINILKQANLFEIVWLCFGGVPAHYTTGIEDMWIVANKENIKKPNISTLVMKYIVQEINKAIVIYQEYVESFPEQIPLLNEFQYTSTVPFSILKLKDYPMYKRPNKVLRIISNDDTNEKVIEPSSNIMKLILKYQWKKAPSYDELLFIASKTHK